MVLSESLSGQRWPGWCSLYTFSRCFNVTLHLHYVETLLYTEAHLRFVLSWLCTWIMFHTCEASEFLVHHLSLKREAGHLDNEY